MKEKMRKRILQFIRISSKRFLMLSCLGVFSLISLSQVEHPIDKPCEEGLLHSADRETQEYEKKNEPLLDTFEFRTGSRMIIMLHGGWGENQEDLSGVFKEIKNLFYFIFHKNSRPVNQKKTITENCPHSHTDCIKSEHFL